VAALQKNKIKGAAPKVRNANRGPGYWVGLHNSRDNGDRVLTPRNSRLGINGFDIGLVGSAAYRRLQAKRSR
jgi:hypothetical protein